MTLINGATLQGVKLKFLGEKNGSAATTEDRLKYYTTYLIFTSLPHTLVAGNEKKHIILLKILLHTGDLNSILNPKLTLKPLLKQTPKERAIAFYYIDHIKWHT